MVLRSPTPEQCQQAADQAIESSRRELDARKINWDLLADKIKDELEYEESVPIKQAKIVKTGKGKERKVVVVQKVIQIKTPAAMTIRQKSRISAHELRGDFPPKETRIAGPGGGPIPITKLMVEFVKSGQEQKRK
jgi:hypothetical protein